MIARFILTLVAGVYLIVAPALAQDISEADKSAFQSIITQQIEAFKVGDHATAYSLASPGVQSKFRNPVVFGDDLAFDADGITGSAAYTFALGADADSPDVSTLGCHMTVVVDYAAAEAAAE